MLFLSVRLSGGRATARSPAIKNPSVPGGAAEVESWTRCGTGALTAAAQHDPSQCEESTDEGEGAGFGDGGKPNFSKTGKVVSAFHLVVVAINNVINTVLFFRCVNFVT